MALRVVIEDLAASAIAVTGHGEDLACACAAADGRLEAAQPGWQGRSAVALAALASRWTDEGRSLVVGLGGHAERLSVCAREFWSQDQQGAGELGSAG